MRTKHGASRLARQLEKDGFTAESIHGDKSQQARMEALEAFKEGKLQVLVATDVAARGLDIDMLPHVLNYELPHVPEDYIHRIGRTGRAGASGEAISFVAPEEEKYLAEIERLLKKKVPIVAAEGFDVIDRPHGAPRAQRRPAHREARRAHASARPRTPRRPSAQNARRATPASCAARRRRRRTSRRAPNAPHGDSRREERERAYALNPDQPLPQPLCEHRGARRRAAQARVRRMRRHSHKARPCRRC